MMIAIKPLSVDHRADVQAYIEACLGDEADLGVYVRNFFGWRFSLAFWEGNEAHGVFIEDGGGERLIALIHLEHRHLSYGLAVLRVAMIRHLSTLPEARHQGYASSLLRDTLTNLAEEGVHLALMYDATGYYEHYGFYPIMPDYELCYERAEALAMPELRRAPLVTPDDGLAQGDIHTLKALYDDAWGGRVSLSRDYRQWGWHYALHGSGMHIARHEGRLVGYACGHVHHGALEVVAEDEMGTYALLRHYARQGDEPVIRWHVPPDDRLVSYARALLPIELRARYRPSGGWVGRIIDANNLVKVLIPEIRAQHEGLEQGLGGLKMDVEPHAVHLTWKGTSQALNITHQDFVGLLFGTTTPATLGHLGRIGALHQHPLNALFPRRITAIAPLDA